ncbi:hypothetical protein [Ruminococcus bromii]|uniref:hypothetical protein n=1 Tax=Ruminococcus bromii TaxID=40518 RepID=UPI0003405748|nr:unknown [Ruminococcus sp. CAG:488]
MRELRKTVFLANQEKVYAVDISNEVTTAYYFKVEALKHGNNIITMVLPQGAQVTLVANVTDDNVGLNESIEIDSSRIKYIDGEYRYE